jgi:hypothetical protein
MVTGVVSFDGGLHGSNNKLQFGEGDSEIQRGIGMEVKIKRCTVVLLEYL